MKSLEWNEEYSISAEKPTEYGIKKIKTIKGFGFISRYEAKKESKKLESLGYKNIKISITKWIKEEE